MRLGTRRTVEAVAYNGATPRSSTTVARFSVATLPRPGRVRGLKLAKGVLTWRAQRGIARYEVALQRPDGTTTLHSTRRARLKITGLPRSGTLGVSVAAFDTTRRAGPIATAKYKLTRRLVSG